MNVEITGEAAGEKSLTTETEIKRGIRYMREALAMAVRAGELDEAPVGAVIVRGDSIISAACNRRESDKRAIAHAEILAIDEACRALGGWRLHECEMFVTLEPCPMCAGAIINSRLRRVTFGAFDLKAGCCGSVIDLFALPFNHTPQVTGGVLREECAARLSEFFKGKRKGQGQARIL